MPNLLDTIRQNRQTLASPAQAGIADDTQKVQNLLRAKSGRAVGSPDSTTSNLGEQQAVAGTQAQLGQIGQEAQVQGQAEQVQQAGTQQQEQEQRQQVDQARKFDTVQNRLQTQSILNNLSQNKDQLDTEKKAAGLEQASFLLSMQDKQYTDTLQDIGHRRRLDNDVNFRQEMEKLTFGDSLDLLRQKLGNQDVLSASDRSFKQAMSTMSIDDAVAVAAAEAATNDKLAALDQQQIRAGYTSEAAAQNIQAQSQGLSGLVSAGAKAADVYANSKNKPEAEQ